MCDEELIDMASTSLLDSNCDLCGKGNKVRCTHNNLKKARIQAVSKAGGSGSARSPIIVIGGRTSMVDDDDDDDVVDDSDDIEAKIHQAVSCISIAIQDIMTPPVSAGGDKDKHADKQTNAAAATKQRTKDMPPPPPDPISQAIGEFGRWQFLLTVLLSLVNFPCTFHIFAPTFEGAQRDFWCARPIGLNMPVEQWKNISGVFDFDKDGNAVYDPCKVKDVTWSFTNKSERGSITFSNDSVSWKTCQEWEYNVDDFGKTIISEWNLVCENQQLSNLAEMMFLLGVAVGGLASGFFSDRLGRKKTLMVSLLLQIILGLSIAFVPWLSVYLVLRALLGFVCVSVVFSGFVLCMELVGGKWLTISGVSYLFPLPLAYIVISGIAYYIRDWRNLQVAITVPAIPFLILWWVMPESPRWLLTMGRVEETMNVLKEAAQVNRIELPPDTQKMLSRSISKVDMSEAPKVGLGDLFRTPRIRKISFVLYIVWFTVYLIYYGVVLNLSSLGGNIYINSIISGAVEFPAIAISILFLLKMGRRWPLCLTVIGAGISCLLTIPVSKDFHWLKITFAMAAKFCISSSNVVMPVYTAELFPTIMRNLGVGSSNVPAGVALMLVPYLWNLADMHPNMPMGVLGFFGIIGGASVLLLPETENLANTLSDIE